MRFSTAPPPGVQFTVNNVQSTPCAPAMWDRTGSGRAGGEPCSSSARSSSAGPCGWRLRRDGGTVTFDLTGVPFDLPELWAAARHPQPGEAKQLTQRLRRPILTRWAYHDWVLRLRQHNERLADELSSTIGYASASQCLTGLLGDTGTGR